ncbi:component of gems protein 1-like [Diaphorina citri]|uniref:Component of gems protein 1-like n=1 Tax=Diaphorina citri TaxID=121845 RepID=A0A1S3CUY8_DIACI|nr:component of gems protein 1-like [Diaphorina citri]XP_026676246.1 component of gems protein 1-like [Diaphorina citri]KAI5732046.1 hypothetical protein M8J77_020377 [Diaphorina citri]
MYGEERPFYSSPGPLEFGVESHHSYSSDATEYSVNEMKYNNYPLNENFYNGSQQSTISDDCQYNDIGRDYFKLPGFHQTFGSTEIGRFSQHDEIFEQIQNQLLSTSVAAEPAAPSTNSPLSSLIDHHNNVLSESHNQSVTLHQTLPSAKKPKAKTQRRTKSTASKSNKNSSSSNNSVANVSHNMPSYSSMEHHPTPTHHPMPESSSKYWNNQMSSYYDRPYIPTPNPIYPYHHHMNHNYSPPASLHDHGTMCNNYECRYHHTSYPYNSYQNSYYENPYYSSQQYHYSHNYHSNYWGYNCQTV